MMHRILCLVLTLMTVVSCGQDTPPAEQVAGEWQGVRWVTESQAVTDDPSQVIFVFEMPDKYAAIYGSQDEKGTFKVNDGRLYTQSDQAGAAPMMVRFERLQEDTLTLKMNRGGRMETLVLGRRK
ncbi:MAG: hypothetical protein IPJ06_16855 [Saprospiraceae bacterium]|nr:hypothetical protein [Saprospiraceae bacterium]